MDEKAAGSLSKKLAYVMTKVQYIQKRGYNSFHKYNYATEADVNDAVREHLASQGVVMLPSIKQHTMRETTTNSGVTEYIVCVDMDFTFIDGESGEQLTISMSGEGQDRGDKAIYKAISGAQKYALMKLFMIPTGDDPEGDTSVDERNHGTPQQTRTQQPQTAQPTQPQRQQQRPQPHAEPQQTRTQAPPSGSLATDKQLNFLQKKAAEKGLDGVKFTEWVQSNVHHPVEQLTKKEASDLIDALARYTIQQKEVRNDDGFGTEDPFA